MTDLSDVPGMSEVRTNLLRVISLYESQLVCEVMYEARLEARRNAPPIRPAKMMSELSLGLVYSDL